MGRLRLGFAQARARLVAGCARAQFNFFLTVITIVDKEWCKLSAKTIFLSGPNKDRWDSRKSTLHFLRDALGSLGINVRQFPCTYTGCRLVWGGA